MRRYYKKMSARARRIGRSKSNHREPDGEFLQEHTIKQESLDMLRHRRDDSKRRFAVWDREKGDPDNTSLGTVNIDTRYLGYMAVGGMEHKTITREDWRNIENKLTMLTTREALQDLTTCPNCKEPMDVSTYLGTWLTRSDGVCPACVAAIYRERSARYLGLQDYMKNCRGE